MSRRRGEVLAELRERGACHGPNVDPGIFFPDPPDAGTEAKAVCARCPVSDSCREWGVAHEAFGIWGGLSAKQRQRVRKERGITLDSLTSAKALASPCGTAGGAQAHLRRGEPLCVPCRRARALAYQESDEPRRRRLARAGASSYLAIERHGPRR